VGSDSLYAGTVEMEELAKLAGGKGDVVILQGQVSNEAAVLRTQGCNDVVAKNPGMKVAATQSGEWDRAKGQAITENWIQSGTLKEGMVVCANNDEMALGAINALKAAKLLDKVFVGGVDATSEALAAMKAGDLEVTVFQDAVGQGKGGVDAAVKLMAGETVPDYVDIPYVLVTPANMADYMGAN
jgi:ABC-type sugar transport system substrate-binding protein